jgi:hypothetical protein
VLTQVRHKLPWACAVPDLKHDIALAAGQYFHTALGRRSDGRIRAMNPISQQHDQYRITQRHPRPCTRNHAGHVYALNKGAAIPIGHRSRCAWLQIITPVKKAKAVKGNGGNGRGRKGKRLIRKGKRTSRTNSRSSDATLVVEISKR